MPRPAAALDHARRYAERYGASVAICEAPMAGSSTVARAAAVAAAGGIAGYGAYTAAPDAIRGMGRRVPRGSG